MSESKKLTAQVRRYDRATVVARKADPGWFADWLEEMLYDHPWRVVAPFAAVGAAAAAYAGEGWERIPVALAGGTLGVVAMVVVVPLVAAAVWLVCTPVERLALKVPEPSEAERVLYSLEQYRKNSDLNWLADDLDAALPAARRAAKTGRALRKASTTANATAARRALGECLPGLQDLAGRCFSEAEKAKQTASTTVAVTVQKTREEVPCYLYATDAEDVRRTAAVAKAVATFRDETLSRQEQPSM